MTRRTMLGSGAGMAGAALFGGTIQHTLAGTLDVTPSVEEDRAWYDVSQWGVEGPCRCSCWLATGS